MSDGDDSVEYFDPAEYFFGPRKRQKLNSFAEDGNYVEYKSFPSLKSVAALTVVTRLWNLPDCKRALTTHFMNENDCEDEERGYDEFVDIEKLVAKKVSSLPVPKVLKQEVLHLVRPIGLQLVQWLNNRSLPYLFCNDLSAVCWTPYGVIDKVKTLQKFEWVTSVVNLRTQEDNLFSLFRYASLCCAESFILTLWSRLPGKLKLSFKYQVTRGNFKNYLTLYWLCFCENELPKLPLLMRVVDEDHDYVSGNSINENMFMMAVMRGHDLAAKYFWVKLTEKEIEENMFKWFDHAGIRFENKSTPGRYQEVDGATNVIFFLLSKNRESNLRAIFSSFGEVTFMSLCIKSWPWQNYLLPTLRAIWKCMRDEVLYELLLNLNQEVKEFRNTEKLLRQVWCESPVNLKKGFIRLIKNDPKNCHSFFSRLLKVEDLNTVAMILEEATEKERKTIILNSQFGIWPSVLVEKGELELLESFLYDMSLSNEDIKQLKRKIEAAEGRKICLNFICRGDFESLEQFMNWLFVDPRDIEQFKKKRIIKRQMLKALLKDSTKESFDKFLLWYFVTEEAANQYKRGLLQSLVCNKIFDLCTLNWRTFEKFLTWISLPSEEIEKFKRRIRSELERCWESLSSERENCHDIYEIVWITESRKFVSQFRAWCSRVDSGEGVYL